MSAFGVPFPAPRQSGPAHRSAAQAQLRRGRSDISLGRSSVAGRPSRGGFNWPYNIPNRHSLAASKLTFTILLEELAHQHEKEVEEAGEAVYFLQEENRRLQEELRHLHAGRNSQSNAGEKLAAPPLGVPPRLQDFDTHEVEELEAFHSPHGIHRFVQDAHQLEEKHARGDSSEPPQRRASFVAQLLPARPRLGGLRGLAAEPEEVPGMQSSPLPGAVEDGQQRQSQGRQLDHVSALGPGDGVGAAGGQKEKAATPETVSDPGEDVVTFVGEEDTPKTPKRSVTWKTFSNANLEVEGVDRTVAKLDRHLHYQNKERFRMMFHLHGSKRPQVAAPQLVKVLSKRGMKDFDISAANEFVSQLNMILAHELQGDEGDEEAATAVPSGRKVSVTSLSKPRLQKGLTRSGAGMCVELDDFVRLMLMPGLPLHFESPGGAEIAREVQAALLRQDVDEVIARIVRKQVAPGGEVEVAPLGQPEGEEEEEESCVEKLRKFMDRELWVLNTLVSLAIIASILGLGLSLDFDAQWGGWQALEIACATVFVMELLTRWFISGCRGYWVGREWAWNWFDFIVTAVTLADIVINWDIATTKGSRSRDRVSILLRTLRITRVIRLVKLLRGGFFRQLTNMFAGILLGLPWIFWILVLLLMVVFVLALAFRQFVGPEPGQDLSATCGDADLHTVHDEECPAHYLYGEEHFGSISKSMFTVFHCITGECLSAGGKPLPVILTDGFGIKFGLTYCLGMVLILFGLFNVITAMFVESTLSGVKYNDAQKKKARLYESQYVQKKVEALVERVTFLHSRMTGNGRGAGSVRLDKRSGGSIMEISFSEQELQWLMQDSLVQELLREIDVAIDVQTCSLEIFNTDICGRVSVADLLSTLLKMRGELVKSDMVEHWVVLRSLHTKFQEFELILLKNQRQIMETQRALISCVESGEVRSNSKLGRLGSKGSSDSFGR